MKKLLAVRLRYASDSAYAFRTRNNITTEIHSTSAEKLSPAIKNVSQALYDKGVEYFIDDCPVFWLIIENKLPLEDYFSVPEVEYACSYDWFHEQTKRIRNYAGLKYIEACDSLVKDYVIKPQDRKFMTKRNHQRAA
jgi:hypothetical protein